MPEPQLLERLSEFSELGLFLLGVVYLLARYFPWAKVTGVVFGKDQKSSAKPPPSGESVADAVLRRFNEEQERKQVAMDTRDHAKRTADVMEAMNGKLTTSAEVGNRTLEVCTKIVDLSTEQHKQTTTMIASLAELLEQAHRERQT